MMVYRSNFKLEMRKIFPKPKRRKIDEMKNLGRFLYLHPLILFDTLLFTLGVNENKISWLPRKCHKKRTEKKEKDEYEKKNELSLESGTLFFFCSNLLEIRCLCDVR